MAAVNQRWCRHSLICIRRCITWLVATLSHWLRLIIHWLHNQYSSHQASTCALWWFNELATTPSSLIGRPIIQWLAISSFHYSVSHNAMFALCKTHWVAVCVSSKDISLGCYVETTWLNCCNSSAGIIRVKPMQPAKENQDTGWVRWKPFKSRMICSRTVSKLPVP